jgi:predicted naringenin-chalcone synthase
MMAAPAPSCVVIAGIGTAMPVRSIAQADAVTFAQTLCTPADQQARLLPILYGRSGVRRRGSVLLEPAEGASLTQSFFPPCGGTHDRGPTTEQRMARYAQEAAPLAQAASCLAIGDARLNARAITQLVTVSCTGFLAPGIDIALIKRLELPDTVGRTHIGFMGCHGALNGIRVASALVAADPTAQVLLCAVELCSLHFHYGWDPEKIVANALFADGAGAMVIASDRRDIPDAWRVAANGSCLVPDSEDAMTWRIGDHGFEMTLSPRVPSLIGSSLRPWLVGWLEGHGFTLRDVRSWAIHPGGPRIIEAAAQALGLTPEATGCSAQVLAECGNMSSATTIFLLERLRRSGAPRPCVALGFGPGLVVEAALFL